MKLRKMTEKEKKKTKYRSALRALKNRSTAINKIIQCLMYKISGLILENIDFFQSPNMCTAFNPNRREMQ